jgi:hypothetical protein
MALELTLTGEGLYVAALVRAQVVRGQLKWLLSPSWWRQDFDRHVELANLALMDETPIPTRLQHEQHSAKRLAETVVLELELLLQVEKSAQDGLARAQNAR